MLVYTVAELSSYIKLSLDRNTQIQEIWVSGEISNLTRSAAGHAYFTLKEDNVQLKCVFFRGGKGGDLLDNGIAVNTHGRVSLYEARGDLQLYVQIVQPSGEGAQALELARLKFTLEKEGLFETSRKRALPSFPRKVGIVTSERGAVFHDISTVIERRFPLVELFLSPCSVQGERAPAEICAALARFPADLDLDVIILARGGGSAEELGAFNTEAVARAIYASSIPIISAIGHETDVTIADFVADVRAPTPSAAAELVTPDRSFLQVEIRQMLGEMVNSASYTNKQNAQTIAALVQRLHFGAPDTRMWKQRVDELMNQTAGETAQLMTRFEHEMESLKEQLQILEPRAVMRRGYAIVTNESNASIVTSVQDVAPNDSIQITVGDGTFWGNVKNGGKD